MQQFPLINLYTALPSLIICALRLAKKNLLAAHAHQKMKMVGHQAIGKGLANRIDVLDVFFQEVTVVIVVVKEVYFCG